ncbi:hypothetical protein CS022_04965 [Veronia nyctiphanis]|uniref:Uncharacterized protein n=1 Tax=Veronia nyctiphanis TaxID=1278244 RepID=A0A4Q0YTG5_9GAMM|nr:hypothetical protein [Veronia nyctiphanis]RXJ74005.1 hypothetical protein CS022_04965 [Veronia nyctiphanis]
MTVNTIADARYAETEAFSDGGYVVTWHSSGINGTGSGIATQRFDSEGNKVGGETVISSAASNDQDYASITVLDDDSYVVVWVNENPYNDTSDIAGQRFSKDGLPLGDQFTVNAVTGDTDDSQYLEYPDITSLPDGGFAVVWEFNDSSSDQTRIHAQRFSSEAQKVGDELIVSQLDSYTLNTRPHISASDDGKMIVTWGDDVNGSTDVLIKTYSLPTTLTFSSVAGDDFSIDSNELTDGKIAIEGKVVGDFSTTSSVTFWIGDKQVGTGEVDAAGNVTASVALSGLIGHGSLTAKLDVADAAGNTGALSTSIDYSVDSGSFLTLDPLTDNNIIDIEESEGTVDITGQYSIASVGDVIEVSVNGKTLTHTMTQEDVDAGGHFSITVDGADLAATDNVSVSIRHNGQEVVHHTHNYTVDLNDPSDVQASEADVVNTHLESAQEFPTSAYFSDGSYVVAWQSYDQDGDDYGIFAQHFDAEGNKIGSEYQLNSTTEESQFSVSITVFDDDTFMASWSNYPDSSGSPNEILGQKFNKSGEAISEEIDFEVSTDSNYQSSITELSDGGYVMTWHSYESSTPVVKSQRFDADGNKEGSEITVNTTEGARYAETEAFSDGGYVVSWHSSGFNGTGSGIATQRFDSEGNKVGGETVISSAVSNDQEYASITVLDDDSYVVVWVNENPYNDTSDIAGQRFSKDGSPLGDQFAVNAVTGDTDDSQSLDYPNITSLPDGGFAVVWEFNDSASDQTRIHAQRFSSETQKVGDEIIVTELDSYNANTRPHISASDDGKMIVTWGDDVNGSTDVLIKTFTLPVTVTSLTKIQDGTENGEESSDWPGWEINMVRESDIAIPLWLRFDDTTNGENGATYGEDYTGNIHLEFTLSNGRVIKETVSVSSDNLTVKINLPANVETIKAFAELKDDALIENTESIVLHSSMSGEDNTWKASEAAAIKDNEGPAVVQTITPDDTEITEGDDVDLSWTVTLNNASSTDTTLRLDINNVGNNGDFTADTDGVFVLLDREGNELTTVNMADASTASLTLSLNPDMPAFSLKQHLPMIQSSKAPRTSPSRQKSRIQVDGKPPQISR